MTSTRWRDLTAGNSGGLALFNIISDSHGRRLYYREFSLIGGKEKPPPLLRAVEFQTLNIQYP
jgi:hypothetical protein